jgi:hypothetical protein
MQQGGLPQFLSAESATAAVAQMRHHVAWCGMVPHGAFAFRRNVQAFAEFCGLFAYAVESADW